jgi:tRNA-specific 2-thiouridylase
MRVLAALSGGVDSAVAAARAVDAGHEVVGVHMALSRSRAQHRNGSRGCCSIEDAGDARRAADVLGIPYYVWDLSEEFEDTVVADFLSEYEAGRTPNPCVRCNEHIKFSALLDRGVALGFDAVATGHYARIAEVADAGGSRRELHRAADPLKDQSYVLAVMGAERLARALFPLGDAPSKDAVRAEAAARGLSVSAKPDSYDICFVADGDTHGFLRERLGARPGEVVDADGRVLGEHDGAYAYTVGQRKGLGLTRPAADGRPRYVLEVRPQTNQVVVGPAELLSVDEIAASQTVWLADDVPAGEWTEVEVQVRAHGDPVPARVRRAAGGGHDAGDGATGADGGAHAGGTHDGAGAGRDSATGAGGGLLEARLARPLRGIAPGQSLVVYSGTRVLGQATISRARREAPLPA